MEGALSRLTAHNQSGQERKIQQSYQQQLHADLWLITVSQGPLFKHMGKKGRD